MTVSSSTNKVSYSGNGSLTTFAYTFKIFDEDDLTVILRAADGTETTQTITTHYTVTGVGVASGGNVVFGSAPASGVTVVIIREQPLTQGLDLVPNDPFPAQSLEEALDKVVFMTQKHEEELSRAIKASRTNTLTGSEFTISATDRANKLFSFDSSGNLSIAQELGTFRGDWAASTSYNARDLVKDTSTNNIFLVNTAHTSSGAQPLTTNANSAKYDLIVDAASATTSATNAAASATTATTKASEAATSASNAATSETNAAASYDSFDDRYLGAKSSDPTVDNDGDALVTAALYFNTTSGMKVYDGSSWDDVKPTTAEQTNIDTVAGISSNVTTVAGIQANVTTVAGVSSDVTTVAGISSNVTTVANDGTDIGTVATNISNVNTVAGISSNVTTVAGISSDVTTVANDGTDIGTVAGISANITTVAGISANVTTVAGISANVTTVASNDANVTTVASNITGVNSFAERYRVGSSDPTTSLDAGDLAFNTTSSLLKYYSGGSWQSISPGIGSLADDSTPQLGGNLDVNGNEITSASDGNVVLNPNGTGQIQLNSTVVVQDGTHDFDVASHDGTNGLKLGGTLVTSTAAELNYLDITTLGLSEASKALTADANGVVSFDNGTIEEVTSITSSSNAATINLRDGNLFEHDLTENVTYTFSNPAASGRASCFILKVIQDASARTITWPTSVDWAAATAPTLTTTNNGVDVFGFVTIDGGTTYYGFTLGQAMG